MSTRSGKFAKIASRPIPCDNYAYKKGCSLFQEIAGMAAMFLLVAKRVSGGFGLLLCLMGAASGAERAAVPDALIQRHVRQGAQIQRSSEGVVVTPPSSISRPEDVGVRAHTNTRILLLPIDRPGPQNAK
jgi:hypothetical protein